MSLISDGQPGSKEREELESALGGRAKERKEQPLKIGEVFAERFTVKSVLGLGALGATYRVFDQVDQAERTLKVFQGEIVASESLWQRFERFVLLAEALQHPHLAPVMTHGKWNERPYLVRAYIEAQSLDALILERKKTRRFFSLEEILHILAEVSQALTAVERRTYHGGLTPSNILLADGKVLVTDLALARIFQPSHFSSLQIYFGNGYYYLAPEYDRAGAKIDQRADLYAAAVIAYEMLTGEIPRSPVVPPSVVNSALPPGIDGPFLKALALNPDARQENLAHFVQHLRALSGLLEPPKPAPVAVSRVEEAAPPVQEAETVVARPPEPIPAAQSAAKNRITQAIEDQLRSHGAQGLRSSAVKAPSLPVSKPKTPVRSSAKWMPKEQIAPEARKKKRSSWLPFALMGAGVVFAALLWVLVDATRTPHLDGDAVEEKAEVAAPKTIPDSAAVAEKPNHAQFEGASLPQNRPESQVKAEEVPAEKPNESAPSADSKPAVRTLEETLSRTFGLGDSSNEKPSAPNGGGAAGTPRNRKNGGGKGATTAASTLVARHQSNCPSGMVSIPAGTFLFGNPSQDRDFLEFAAVTVAMPGFCIDAHEWPNRHGARPQAAASHAEAAQACASVGKRLCSEREWERACRGPQQHAFPYGAQYQAAACNTKTAALGRAAGAGTYNSCKNEWGVFDMGGNLSEWTSGALDRSKVDRMIRGPSFKSSSWAGHCAVRKNRLPEARADDVGFRCCLSGDDSVTRF